MRLKLFCRFTFSRQARSQKYELYKYLVTVKDKIKYMVHDVLNADKLSTKTSGMLRIEIMPLIEIRTK